MNWELVKECIDNEKPYQSKGNKGSEGTKAKYYIKLPENCDFVLLKYDADCVGLKLGYTNRIGDSFFRLISKVEKLDDQYVEKMILVETKGKQDDYFEQLEQSFDLVKKSGFKGNIHGRFIGFNVPASVNFNKEFKKKLEPVERKFISKKGTIRFGNQVMWEDIKNFNESALRTQNEKSKAENIKL
jgi:hypothetical protein